MSGQTVFDFTVIPDDFDWSADITTMNTNRLTYEEHVKDINSPLNAIFALFMFTILMSYVVSKKFFTRFRRKINRACRDYQRVNIRDHNV